MHELSRVVVSCVFDWARETLGTTCVFFAAFLMQVKFLLRVMRLCVPMIWKKLYQGHHRKSIKFVNSINIIWSRALLSLINNCFYLVVNEIRGNTNEESTNNIWVTAAVG